MAYRSLHSLTWATLVLAVLSFASASNEGLNISVYNMNVEKMEVVLADPKFGSVISAEASTFCVVNCTVEFQSNVTAEFTQLIVDSPNVNVTVTIKAPTGESLSMAKTEEIFLYRGETINKQIDQEITAAGSIFYGIPADNPANWIIMAVFVVITLVFLLVVVYLSKHKVNHEKEHFEKLQNQETNDTVEIVA